VHYMNLALNKETLRSFTNINSRSDLDDIE